MIKGWKITLCKAIAFPAWILIAASCAAMALVSCCSWLFIAGPRKVFGGLSYFSSPTLAQRKMIRTKKCNHHNNNQQSKAA
ncbi:MAG: hypothetical protein ACOY35_11990 [Bacillota bacterium]